MTSKDKLKPLFTVVIDVYWGIEFFKKAISAIRNQTYSKLEIIVVNNGASEDISSLIQTLKGEDSRIKVIKYKENLFKFSDPHRLYYVITNEALNLASGEYFFYQSYDDLLALDYIERIVQLFEENPKCLSACGRPVSLNSSGEANKEEMINRKTNFRPRFMAGHEMVLNSLEPEGSRIFSSPGTIFSFRTKTLRDHGGFHRSAEDFELYGIVAFGVTGFDEEAIFYWRRHKGQTNKILSARGWSGLREFHSLIKDKQLKQKWEIHGEDVADNLIKNIFYEKCRASADLTLRLLFGFKLIGSIRAFSYSFNYFYYWKALQREFFKKKRHYFLIFVFQFGFLVKPLINLLDSYVITTKKNRFISRLKVFFSQTDWY